VEGPGEGHEEEGLTLSSQRALGELKEEEDLTQRRSGAEVNEKRRMTHARLTKDAEGVNKSKDISRKDAETRTSHNPFDCAQGGLRCGGKLRERGVECHDPPAAGKGSRVQKLKSSRE